MLAIVRRIIACLASLLLLLPGLLPASVPQAFAAGTSITLSRTGAGRLDAVSVTGRGFAPGDLAAVFVTFTIPNDTKRVNSTVTVSAAGTFVTSLTIPYSAEPGSYQVTARDFHAHTAIATLAVLPVLLLTVHSAPLSISVGAGHGFYLRGNGFLPTELVHITLAYPLYNGNDLVVNRSVVAGAHGSFSDLLLQAAQDTRAGSVTLTAFGTRSRRSATGHVRVSYFPRIIAVQGAVRPGASLTIAGRDFVPSSTVHLSMTITNNGATETLGADVSADTGGSFAAAIAIPSGAGVGLYTVSAIDAVGGFHTTTQFRVAVRAEIGVQPHQVSPGQQITISGAGFGANATVQISAAFRLVDGTPRVVTQTVRSNANGALTAQLTVPSNDSAGIVTIVANGLHVSAQTTFVVRGAAASIMVTPPAAIPGAIFTVRGTGFPDADRVDLAATIHLATGATSNLAQTIIAGSSGAFSAQFRVPTNALGGAYIVSARSHTSGRVFGSHVTVVTLAASIVALPTVSQPGTKVVVRGFGFPAGVLVHFIFNGQSLGGASTGTTGEFSGSLTIPSVTATGIYALQAIAATGARTSINLSVVRQVSDHFYVSSIYTGVGYHEYITFLDPTEVRTRVTITYERKDGATSVKTRIVNAHSRLTEDVNADLGPKVSAAAVIAADVPIDVERVVYHGTDGDVVPGARMPASVWYFANGNTGKHYREYIAIQNPNHTPIQASVRFLPTHHLPFTIFRTVAPTSRLTVKVNTFVPHDAVGAIVRANGPIVANRTIFVYAGITSTDGVQAPQRSWYFASGPQSGVAHHWIALINPSIQRSYVTVHAYGPSGGELGTAKGWVKAGERAGYLLNRISGQPDVAVVVTASLPVVAEQFTYTGARHNASTDTFGASRLEKSWTFATSNTSAARGETDSLELFNPNLVPIPIAVDFIATNGATLVRTYVLGPLNHQHVDVGSVVPEGQVGLVAASNYPFAAINRGSFNFGAGAFTDAGIH